MINETSSSKAERIEMEWNGTTLVAIVGVPSSERNVGDSVNVSLVAFGNPLGLFSVPRFLTSGLNRAELE